MLQRAVRNALKGLSLGFLTATAGLGSGAALAADESTDLVVYLSAYLSGDYYYAELPPLATSNQQHIQPQKLSLPRDFRRSVDLGNHDISRDGRTIVFAARTKKGQNWDIYTGQTDYALGQIVNVERIIHQSGEREEDPRFDWSRDDDGLHEIVYKCSGDICIYDAYGPRRVIENSDCELWAPSFHSTTGTDRRVSYVARCGGAESDRIRYNYLSAPAFDDGESVPLATSGGGPDRFAHYLHGNSLVYSHIMADSGAAALWRYDEAGSLRQLTENEITNSDDDAYPHKDKTNLIAYIGWQSGTGYNLFIYDQNNDRSHKLSHGVPMLAPVIFSTLVSPPPEPPPEPPPSDDAVHVGNLDATAGSSKRRWWSRITVTAHNASHAPAAGITVTLSTGSTSVSCQTDTAGVCTTKRMHHDLSAGSVTYSVQSISGASYDATASEMTSITADKP